MRMLIGDERVAGDRGSYPVVNPATEEVVGEAPEASADQARKECERMRRELVAAAREREALAARLTPLEDECQELRRLETAARQRESALRSDVEAARQATEDAQRQLAEALSGEHQRTAAESNGREQLLA